MACSIKIVALGKVMPCSVTERGSKVSKGPDIPSFRAKGKNCSALKMEAAATFSQSFHLYLSTKFHGAATYKTVIPMKCSLQQVSQTHI
jgi:hypothetical protein